MIDGSPVRADAERDAAVAAAFADALARTQAGTPTLLLITGSAREVRTRLSAAVADSTLGRGTRVIDIEPARDQAYDPVEIAGHMWRQGARRVALDARQRDVAWNWIGVIPLGNLVAAIGETIAVVGRRRSGGDAGLAPILRAASRRAVVCVVHDLHVAARAAALRLCSAIDVARAGTRLLVAAGADPAPCDNALPAIFDFINRLPDDRVAVHRIARDSGALDRLREVSADAATAVQAAAILGSVFDGVMLARLLAIDELDVEDRLAVAVRAGLLRVTGTVDLPDGDVATAYIFQPAALRDAVLATVPASVRASLESRIP